MRAARFSFAVLLLLLVAVPAFAIETGGFDSDGVQIQYVTAGQGDPVILIHGFVANAQLNWIAPGVFEALSKDYRVIAPDLRGHGQSGKPHGAENYGPKMAKDIINLMDHLKIEKAHIIGYSLGGFITVYIAAKYPDRVICAIPGGAGWTKPGDAREAISEQIAVALENGQGITPLIKALTPAGQPEPSQEQIDATNKMLVGMNDVQALASVARGLKALEVPESDIKAIKVPMRDVVGEVDPLKTSVDDLKKALPALDVVIVPGANHMTTFGDPRYLAAVQEFLGKHASQHHTQEHHDHEKSAAGVR
jgi:pimeloyl-ACP methyl ester carboxylesterase